MWKVVLQCLAFLLVAGIANAQGQIGASPKSTTGGLEWVYDFDSGDVAGVYLIGKAAPSTSIGFELGVGFSAVLYVCDTRVADPATETDTCDVVQTLTGDVAQTVYRKKPNRRWFLIDINTAETAGSVSTLGLDGSYMELSTSGGGGGGGTTIGTEDEGSTVDLVASKLNFVGAGVTATDAGSNRTLVTIPGGGGGVVKVYSEPPSNILPLADYSMEQASYADTHPNIATQEGAGLSVDLHLPITGHIGGRNNMGVGFDLVSNSDGLGGESSLEPDNIMGFWYNGKIGPALVNSNPFEHAFTWRVETNYKNATATAGSNWIEFNKDFYPPDLSCVMNAWSNEGLFNTAAGVLGSKVGVTWSGGGTAWVLDYDASSEGNTHIFKFRMDNNTVVAANETATVGGQTATCNGTDMLYLGNDHQFRGEQLVWDVEDGSYGLSFYTGPLNTLPPTAAPTGLATELRNHAVALKLQDEGVLINGPIGGVGVPPGLSAYGPVAAGNQSALYAYQYSDDGVDQSTGGSAPANSNRGITIEMDYQGVGQSFNGNAALYITGPPPGFAMGGGTVASTIQNPYAIFIEDQEGFDTTASAMIRIASQSCSQGGAANPCSRGDSGNLAMVGGTWNTGHIILGGVSSGTHIYRDAGYNTLKMRPNDLPYGTQLTQGNAIVTGSNKNTHGPAFWAVSDGASFDTGNEVCGYTGTNQDGGVGLTCVSPVIRLGTAATEALSLDSSCTDTVTSGDTFIVKCK